MLALLGTMDNPWERKAKFKVRTSWEKGAAAAEEEALEVNWSQCIFS